MCITSVCLAQETYHNEEFGFTVNIPSGWEMTTWDQLPDKTKTSLEKALQKSFLIIHLLDVEPPKNPCILVRGHEIRRGTTSGAISKFKKTGKEHMMKITKYFGKHYQQVDSSYDYDPKRYVGVAKILYQHKNDDTYLLSTCAKFIGVERVVDFEGRWKGDDPEEFWQVFTEVIDSFELDPDATPKGGLGKITQEIKEVSELSDEQKFNRIWKWGGIILTISIILGFVKMLLARR